MVKRKDGMELITSTQARDILQVGGRPINWRTFIKLIKNERVQPEQVLAQGTCLYDEGKIVALKKKLPSRRNPGKSYFKGENMKKLITLTALLLTSSLIQAGERLGTELNMDTNSRYYGTYQSEDNDNYKPVSYTTQKIGKFEFTNGSDGSNYTTQRIGKFEYTNGSNGYSSTTQTIGNTEYTTVTNPGRRNRR